MPAHSICGSPAVTVGLLFALLTFPGSSPAQPLARNSGGAPGGGVEVHQQGTAVPGSRVTIGPDGPIPAGTTFHWTQVEGTPVELDDPAASKIQFTVPGGSRKLVFAMSVKDARGERTTRVTVPIATPPDIVERTLPATSAADLVADAGDDQMGLVGRRMTLNGMRSRPAGRIGFCWLQLAGPPAAEVEAEGGYYVFVPTAPGVYRFALLVALDSQISKPDILTVEVGLPQAEAAKRATPTPPSQAPDATPLARAIAATIVSLPRGAETASQIADVLESVSDRAPLYTSYGELHSELTRRLDVIVPADRALRGIWTNQVFLPLSQLTTAELAAAGIDPRDEGRPLDRVQKERLQTIYQSLAGAFRARPVKP